MFNEALGYEQSELLGRSIFEHIHNEDRRNAISQFSKAIDQFRKGTATYRFKHKSGQWRWLESIAGPFLTADMERRAVISSRDITERMESEKKLQEAFSEIETLKDQLEKENVYLRKEIELSYSHSDIIGQSKAITGVLAKIEQVASTDATVLLTGETGTGKELFANRIHNLSNRRDRAIVKVNCAALPPNLIESELFGHEKGAFTGAVTKNTGRFEVADGSTLFLDEVGELPPELQSKLLRVLQEGEFQRVGSSKTISVDVRVVAATNQNLLEAVNNGRFREDLYYRLNVFPVNVPPLRERKEDIADLLWFYISEFEQKMDKTIKNISRRDMENLINYPWPGNVRQLRNVIERAMIISTGPDLEIELPGIRSNQAPSEMKPIEEVERDHISYILNMTNWRIRGKSGAAEILGLKPTTLESRIKRLGIKRGH
jgi:PAS domain S-box-containing protein